MVSSVPVVVYAHEYNTQLSGATLLLPVETYGYTNDSKIFQNNSYNIAAWHLSFEQDRSGNRVTYTYTQDAVAKTHLLSRISYNGYAVEFVYELRGDTSSGYIAPNTLLAEQHRLTLKARF